MSARHDYTGQRFGQLTVVQRFVLARKDPSKVRTFYWCVCDCGRKVRVQSDNLIAGDHLSCGCVRAQATSVRCTKNGALGRVIASYQHNAKTRGHVWELSVEEALAMLRADCFYCGVAPAFTRRSSGHTALYNGLDRIDNAVGYVKGNVVTACFPCNRAKNDMTQEAFIAWARRLALHLRFIDAPEEGEG